MNKINWSTMKQSTWTQLKEQLPIELVADGETTAYLCDAKDTLVLTGLHPTMKAKLINIYRQAAMYRQSELINKTIAAAKARA